MNRRMSWPTRLTALQIMVFAAAAASPAAANHHRHSAAAPHHHVGGEQQGNTGGPATSGAPKDTHPGGAHDQDASGNPDIKHGKSGVSGGVGDAAPHSGDHAGSKPTVFGTEPIDTSITIVGSPKTKRPGWAFNWKKAKAASAGNAANSPGMFFGHRHDRMQTHAHANPVVTNALGLSVPLTHRNDKGADAKLSALPGISGAPKGDAAVTLSVAHQGFVPVSTKPHDPPVNVATIPMSIGGRGLIRPGSNAGVIGGSNKMAGGIIRGSDFHPKIP